MAQADASGLTQGARKLADTVEKWINGIPTPSKRADTSWHESMVKAANEGFKRQSENRKPVASAAKQTTVKKKTTPKSGVKKRVAGKQ